VAPRSLDELARKFPLAKRIVYSLIEEGMIVEVSADQGESVFKLSARGKEFMERCSLYASRS
tara:strand:- start:279 stop:464 length:186 start_codon:yes stop_codon:yes gene_type:complete